MLDREQGQYDADQRHGRSDRQVEVTRDDQHDGADGRQADNGGLQSKQHQVSRSEEYPVGGEVEEQPNQCQDHEQHGIAQRRHTHGTTEHARQTVARFGLVQFEIALAHHSPSSIACHSHQIALGKVEPG